jgi:hypothetical protein
LPHFSMLFLLSSHLFHDSWCSSSLQNTVSSVLPDSSNS